MPNSTLTAKANVGAGADQLATFDTPQGKAGAVGLVLSDGSDVNAGNPFPVEVQNGYLNVQQTNPDSFKVTLSKQEFFNSTGNNSSAQLNAAAVFTGAWESIFNVPAAQVLAVSNQPMTYEVQQSIDAAGTQIVSTVTFTRLTGVPLCENVQLNANYFRVRATNTGGSSTTTFALNTTLGSINPLPQALTNSGNLRVAEYEIAPLALTTYSQAGVIAINTDLLVIDCAGLRGLSIQCASMGTTGVVTPAWSDDGTNYPASATLMTPAGALASTFNAAGLWVTRVYGRYLRLRLTTATTAGTTTIHVQGSTLPMGQPVSQPISGSVSVTGVPSIGGQSAHSAAASGNPVQIGGVVATAVSTAEVAGDMCRLQMTTGGAAVVRQYAPPELDWSYAAASGGITNTTDVVIKAAAGASIRNYLTSISVTNASATISTEVVVKDGATVIWRGFVGTSALLNSAVNVTFPTPLKSTANTALNVACITTGSAVYVNAQGYTAV